MLPDDRDSACIWDMLNEAREIQQFLAGIGLAEYLKDRKLQNAIERSVEIIGEAARRISEPTKLAHEYGEAKQNRMWLLATKSIPELIVLLEKLEIPALPDDA